MPVSASQIYISSKVQRAYRINNIEQCRLSGTLHLLEKQKVHQMRLANQDIRLISVSLDYLQSSSGKSPEGVAPDSGIRSESEEESSSEDEDASGPCFMYGERIVSRRARRFRSQSAIDRGRSIRGSTSSLLSDSVTSLPDRPQSSPARRPPVFLWQCSRVDDADKNNDSESERTEVFRLASRSITNGCKYDWENDTSDATKKILKAQAQRRKDPRRALPSAIRRRGAFNDMSTSPAGQLPLKIRSSTPNLYPPTRIPSSSSHGPGRQAKLSEILNQRRPTMSASQWRDHLNHTHSAPISVEVARQQEQQGRLKVNDHARVKIQARVRGFMEARSFQREFTL